jgi:hypothetical protein
MAFYRQGWTGDILGLGQLPINPHIQPRCDHSVSQQLAGQVSITQPGTLHNGHCTGDIAQETLHRRYHAGRDIAQGALHGDIEQGTLHKKLLLHTGHYCTGGHHTVGIAQVAAQVKHARSTCARLAGAQANLAW